MYWWCVSFGGRYRDLIQFSVLDDIFRSNIDIKALLSGGKFGCYCGPRGGVDTCGLEIVFEDIGARD